ncbi:hypothetical protein ymoll0001_38570 [Yersinia mollaretii ATCC 43969]|uniref:Thymidine kinase n=1 Tax=Yersinia mollaretii (strain ATCC 43969 / DSM 18520 / CIP 103324 / CNY 7263 / WAIP 204) TaxID=349967 RepID=A0ABM9Y7E3_YERMW|nr:hypothetical protein ymoll0001_38570 [Yersinia mollaretii ATCC 43969]
MALSLYPQMIMIIIIKWWRCGKTSTSIKELKKFKSILITEEVNQKY